MREFFILVAGNFAFFFIAIPFFAELPLNEWRFRENLYKNSSLLFLFLMISGIFLGGAMMDGIVGCDFTWMIYKIEGDTASFFQQWNSQIMDYYLIFVYLVGFPFLIYFTPFLYLISHDSNALRLATFTYGIALLLILPFYLFFPVNNSWWASQNCLWYEGREIAFRLKQILPGIETTFYRLTSMNNSFPSAHCCLSSVMALTSWIKKYKKYAILATIFAISIPISTLYLGIHWLMDVLFGEIFAVIAIVIGKSFSNNRNNIE